MNKIETDTLLLPVIGESPAGDDISMIRCIAKYGRQDKMIRTICLRGNGLSVNPAELTGEK